MRVAQSIGATDEDIRRAQAVAAHPDPIAEVATIASPVLLHLVASEYNWNDGFDIPFTILRSSHCDRGTAVMLFWLACPENLANVVQQEFVTEARRIALSGSLKAEIPFDPASFFGWNRLYRRKLELAGFPTSLLGASPGRSIADASTKHGG